MGKNKKLSLIDKIGIWGNAGNNLNDGYGYAGYKLCKTLNDVGVKTYWHDGDAPIALSFKQPLPYGGNSNQYRIGYTPWESTIVPDGWMEEINSRDLFWTPSKWCQQVFIDNGLTVPSLVVPHGIDPDDWTLEKRELTNKFVFMHMGEPAERKNGQMVVDAFIKVFDGMPNVHLVMKAHAWVSARWMDGKGSIIGPADDHSQITLYPWVLDNAKLNQFFHAVHCLVYPSSGEGFGLIPFEAIATGMPTILPNWSGMSEFAEYGIKVNYDVAPSEHDLHIGDWAWPDFEDLCEKMWEVYSNYEKVAEEAYENALSLREHFTWPGIVSEVMEDLQKRILQ